MIARLFDSTTARVYLSLGSCAVLGGGLLLQSARWGIGLSPDSVVYVGAARSLLAGAGFSMPGESALFSSITHYPPLYSSLLAVIAFLGPDPLDGAMWLNVVIFGINIFLSGFLLFSALRSLRLAMIVSFLTLTAFPIVQVHTMAWSESSFILFELLSILLLLRYLKDPLKQTLILAAAVAGLSLLCRYAGLALVATGILSILFFGGRERRDKVSDALVFAGIGLLPMVVWVGRNWYLGGSMVNRTIAFHPIALEQLLDVPAVLAGWFSLSWVFGFYAGAPLVLGLMVVASLFSYGCLSKAEFIDGRRAEAIVNVMGFVVIIYLGILALSLAFLDAQMPLDSRTLSPIYVPSIICLIGLSIRFVFVSQCHCTVRLLIPIYVSLSLAAQLQVSLNWLQFNYQTGIGYAGREWRESQTLNRLKQEHSSKPLFSNAPDVLYTLLSKPAVMVPRKTHTATNLPNQEYASQISELARKLRQDDGLLIYFYGVGWRWYLPAAEELERTLGLQALVRENDGVIYRAQ
jgi:Dolichyl-phosphate-mannose-protein mannosyltransferase